MSIFIKFIKFTVLLNSPEPITNFSWAKNSSHYCPFKYFASFLQLLLSTVVPASNVVIATMPIIQAVLNYNSNAIIVNDSNNKCCVKDGVQNKIEVDVVLMYALKEIADENDKVGIKIIQFN